MVYLFNGGDIFFSFYEQCSAPAMVKSWIRPWMQQRWPEVAAAGKLSPALIPCYEMSLYSVRANKPEHVNKGNKQRGPYTIY